MDSKVFINVADSGSFKRNNYLAFGFNEKLLIYI